MQPIPDSSLKSALAASGQRWKALLFLLLILAAPTLLHAHSINLEMERAPAGEVFLFYLKLGYEHILPLGLDHILFVVALCLLNTRLSSIVWQSTVFTLAHSVTLTLSLRGVVDLSPGIVEPVIALSIVFVAIENMLWQRLSFRRLLVVFVFGLIHGLGFGAALNEIGLPRNQFLNSVVSFNLGVELGQLTVVLLVFGGLIYPLRKKTNYRKLVVYPASLIIALIAAVWTVQRVAGL